MGNKKFITLNNNCNPGKVNQLGFSIIELAISLVILSTVSLAFHTMTLNSLKQLHYVEDKNSAHQLDREVKRLLEQSSTCPIALGSATVPAVGASRSIVLNSAPSAVKFRAGTDFDSLTIESIQLQNLNVTPANRHGQVEVEVSIGRRRGGATMELKSQKTNVFVETSSAGAITSCQDTSAPVMVQESTLTGVDISSEDVFFPFAKVTFFKKAAPAHISASVNVGGHTSDLWYAVQVRKTINGIDRGPIFYWPDGTGYHGAATQSSVSFIDTSTDTGVAEYQIWVSKMGVGAPKRGSSIHLNLSRIAIIQD